MTKNSENYIKTMQQNAAVLTVVCLMLCLSFNYTFPLHRDSTKPNLLANHTQRCATDKQQHVEGIVDRTKKMAANIEHALKKIMDSTPNDKTKKQAKCSHDKHSVLDGDLSNYEQLVIMKKYPYLDLKEIDFSYHPPPNKNAGQSLNSPPNLGQDPSFCESSDDVPNVEIINRGLSGFALPSKLIKTGTVHDTKLQHNDSEKGNNANMKITSIGSLLKQDSETANPLESLEEDIKEFEKLLGQ